jgi:hypothetical protein
MFNFQAEQLPLVAASMAPFPGQTCMANKIQKTSMPSGDGTLAAETPNSWMVQSMHLQGLQGNYGVCAKAAVISPRLLLNEQKNLDRWHNILVQ